MVLLPVGWDKKSLQFTQLRLKDQGCAPKSPQERSGLSFTEAAAEPWTVTGGGQSCWTHVTAKPREVKSSYLHSRSD